MGVEVRKGGRGVAVGTSALAASTGVHELSNIINAVNIIVKLGSIVRGLFFLD